MVLRKLWAAAADVVVRAITGERRHPSMLPEDEDDPPLVRFRTDPPPQPPAPPSGVVITRIEGE